MKKILLLSILLIVSTGALRWLDVVPNAFSLFSDPILKYHKQTNDWFALSFSPDTTIYIEGRPPLSNWRALPLMVSKDNGSNWLGPVVLNQFWSGLDQYSGEWEWDDKLHFLFQGFNYVTTDNDLILVANFLYSNKSILKPNEPFVYTPLVGMIPFTLIFPAAEYNYSSWDIFPTVYSPTTLEVSSLNMPLTTPYIYLSDDKELDVLTTKDSDVYHIKTNVNGTNITVNSISSNYWGPGPDIVLGEKVFILFYLSGSDNASTCSISYEYSVDKKTWSIDNTFIFPPPKSVTVPLLYCDRIYFEKRIIWINDNNLVVFARMFFITDPEFFEEFKTKGEIPTDKPGCNFQLYALKFSFENGSAAVEPFEITSPFINFIWDENVNGAAYSVLLSATLGEQLLVSYVGINETYLYSMANATNLNNWSIVNIPQLNEHDPLSYQYTNFECTSIYCMAFATRQYLMRSSSVVRVDLVNECITDPPCQYNSTCIDQLGFSTCHCLPGFSNTNENGVIERNCYDIDECKLDVCKPYRECVNTIGSYYCGNCFYGYRLEDNELINICNNGSFYCQHFCENGTYPPGSYTCGCFEEYELYDKFFCRLNSTAIQKYSLYGSLSGLGLIILIILILLACCLPSYVERQKWADLSILPEEARIPWISYQKSKGKGWERKKSYYVKEIKKGSFEWDSMSFMFSKLDGGPIPIKRAYMIYNNSLVRSFLERHFILRNRKEKVPFKPNKETSKEKKWVCERYEERRRLFPWNNEPHNQVDIIPAVHGTNEDSAWDICDTGFASLSTLDDGYFGKGIYFSTSAQYTLPYYAVKKSPAIIVSYLLPGHAFPVTENRFTKESLEGKPIKTKYNSHYVVTQADGKCVAKETNHPLYDEIVIEQESQISPIYMIIPDQDEVLKLSRTFQRAVPTKIYQDEEQDIIEDEPYNKELKDVTLL